MALHQITFSEPLNVSIQETDILYATSLDNETQAGTNNPFGTNRPRIVGTIRAGGGFPAVDHGNRRITVDDTNYTPWVVKTTDFLFFSKDRRVNTSGLLGYYSLAEFRNGSKKEAEMFAAATEYAPSSK
jgi:hypothetical protein